MQKGPDDDRTQKKGRQFKAACGLGSVCTGPQCAVGPAGFLSETCVTSKNWVTVLPEWRKFREQK